MINAIAVERRNVQAADVLFSPFSYPRFFFFELRAHTCFAYFFDLRYAGLLEGQKLSDDSLGSRL